MSKKIITKQYFLAKVKKIYDIIRQNKKQKNVRIRILLGKYLPKKKKNHNQREKFTTPSSFKLRYIPFLNDSITWSKKFNCSVLAPARRSFVRIISWELGFKLPDG